MLEFIMDESFSITLIVLLGNLPVIIHSGCSKKKNKDDREHGLLKDTFFLLEIALAVSIDIFIIGAIISHNWAYYYFGGQVKTENMGLFGDCFGAVNALVSAFAFAGVIVSIFQQKNELELQREELKAQREEFETQNKTLALQRFENTFFNMMELQQRIVEGLSFQDENKEYKGRDFFEGVLKYTSKNMCVFDSLEERIEKYGIKGYDSAIEPSLLDHYFRHFLSFINRAKLFIPEKDKNYSQEEKETENDNIRYEYARILRATLSRYELLWLYYNGLSNRGVRLKPLIEKYSMLNNIDPQIIVLSSDVTQIRDRNSTSSLKEFLRKKNVAYLTDFYYRITFDSEEQGKYDVSAFYHHGNETNKIMAHVSAFNQYVNEWKQLPVEEKGRIFRDSILL